MFYQGGKLMKNLCCVFIVALLAVLSIPVIPAFAEEMPGKKDGKDIDKDYIKEHYPEVYRQIYLEGKTDGAKEAAAKASDVTKGATEAVPQAVSAEPAATRWWTHGSLKYEP